MSKIKDDYINFGTAPVEKSIYNDSDLPVPGSVWTKVFFWLESQLEDAWKEFIFDTPDRKNGGLLIVHCGAEVNFIAIKRPRTVFDYIDLVSSRD